MSRLDRRHAAQALRRGAAAGTRAVDVSAELSRKAARRRAQLFRSRALFIGQAAVASSAAYAVAHLVFDVQVPLLAPVAAMVALGMTHGQRLRRAVEITVGVALGALVGEVFVRTVGMGWWQVAAIVVAGMALATLVGAGTLMATQAAIQGLIVALLAGSSALAFGRWFEALIGTVIALLVATVVPTSVLVRPRGKAVAVLHDVSDLLSRTAAALGSGDGPGIEATLRDARATETDLETLRGYAADSGDIMRITPRSKERREDVAAVAAMIEPMDRAVRNTRVLVRRASVTVRTGEETPAAYLQALERLAAASEDVARAVADRTEPRPLRAELLAIGAATSAAAPGAALSAEVIRAQVRSIVVDYLMVLGMPYAEAFAALRKAG